MRASSTNPFVCQLLVTCEKGADEGIQHESVRLTVAGSNQRIKAKTKEHLPWHIATRAGNTKYKCTPVTSDQWSNRAHPRAQPNRKGDDCSQGAEGKGYFEDGEEKMN